ncbi:MAG: serine/threonine-protein kinase [Myxococcota bacterium]
MSSDDDMKVAEGEVEQQQPPALKTRKKKRRPDPLIGQTIANRYRVLSRIGAGGMGVVYKADQAAMDRKIAIKVLPRDLDDESLIERFHREARAASQLRHPNTITLYDFGQHEDILYIAMEFLDGISLNQAMKRGPMHPGRVISILIQTLRSLGEAHKKGIVHRDIKPDNVFLIQLDGTSDFVKVLDFGVAKLTKSGDKTLTQAGMIFGTPKYMSPEQARSKPTGARSDIYAVGIMAYEMLTGKVPFDADDHVSILLKHCTEPVPPFKEINPDIDVPEDLGQVIVHSLTKKPEERFQSAEEMIQALEVLAPKYPYQEPSSLASGNSSGLHTPLPGQPSTGQMGPSTGSLPPMGRPTPSEVNLTPSGSVDWSGSLELDLGVTAVHHDPLAEDKAQDQGKLLFVIAGGVGLLLILLVIIIALLSNDPEPEDTPSKTPATTVAEEKTTPPPKDNNTDGVDKGMATSDSKTPKTTAQEPPKDTIPKDNAPKEASTVSIKLTSAQPGVSVYSKDKLIGKLPQTLEYEAGDSSVELVFKKPGFVTSKEVVNLSKSTTLSITLKRRNGRPGGKTNPGGLRSPWE